MDDKSETEGPGPKKDDDILKIKINKNLVMLKLTLFFLYGANSSLMPYLTIHMQSIGLTVEQISIIYLTLPLTTFLTPPLTGFLIDKFGHYKPVVIVSFLLTAVIHHSLFIIPHQELPSVMPPGYVMKHPKGDVEVWWSPCPSRECPDNSKLEVVLEACVNHCTLKQLINHNGTISNNKISARNGTIKFSLSMHPDLGDPTEIFGLDIEQKVNTTIDFKNRFTEKLLLKHGVNFTELDENDLRCGGIAQIANDTSKQRLDRWTTNCIVQECQFLEGGPEVCPPDFRESDNKTFWIYFMLRFIGSIVMTAGITIIDPIALTMIEKYGGDFGREKLFSSLGMALFSPITGFLIDVSSEKLGYTDYSAAFYTYDILLIISALTVYLMPLGTKLPADNIFKDLVGIFKMPNVIIFIIFMFFLGNPWGFIENYLFLYLKELGAPNTLLGVTVTVGTISSIPFLYGADRITKKLGHVNIIILAFFAHAARLMGYSFIESAWWCFPFEAMESLSVHLMWVAAATYCVIIAPKGLLATLIGVIGMAHFSIGRGSGSFIGGRIIGEYGIREAFRIMGFSVITCGIAYGLLQYFWLRKLDKELIEKLDECENDLKSNENEPKTRDQGTMVSFERLSLIIEYNQIGSLSSLGRFLNKVDSEITKNHHMRRGSDTYGMFKNRGSAASKDFLRSAIDMNSRNSFKLSIGHLQRHNSSGSRIVEVRTSSAPKLTAQKSVSITDKEIQKLIPDETEEIHYIQDKNKMTDEKSDQ